LTWGLVSYCIGHRPGVVPGPPFLSFLNFSTLPSVPFPSSPMPQRFVISPRNFLRPFIVFNVLAPPLFVFFISDFILDVKTLILFIGLFCPSFDFMSLMLFRPLLDCLVSWAFVSLLLSCAFLPSIRHVRCFRGVLFPFSPSPLNFFFQSTLALFLQGLEGICLVPNVLCFFPRVFAEIFPRFFSLIRSIVSRFSPNLTGGPLLRFCEWRTVLGSLSFFP